MNMQETLEWMALSRHNPDLVEHVSNAYQGNLDHQVASIRAQAKSAFQTIRAALEVAPRPELSKIEGIRAQLASIKAQLQESIEQNRSAVAALEDAAAKRRAETDKLTAFRKYLKKHPEETPCESALRRVGDATVQWIKEV